MFEKVRGKKKIKKGGGGGGGGEELYAIRSSYHKLQLLLFINFHTQQEVENVQYLRTTIDSNQA